MVRKKKNPRPRKSASVSESELASSCDSGEKTGKKRKVLGESGISNAVVVNA